MAQHIFFVRTTGDLTVNRRLWFLSITGNLEIACFAKIRIDSYCRFFHFLYKIRRVQMRSIQIHIAENLFDSWTFWKSIIDVVCVDIQTLDKIFWFKFDSGQSKSIITAISMRYTIYGNFSKVDCSRVKATKRSTLRNSTNCFFRENFQFM